MLRNREKISIEDLGGVDLSEVETKIGSTRFRALENFIPLGQKALQKKPGSTPAIVTGMVQVGVVDQFGNPVFDNNGQRVVVVLTGSEVGTGIVRLHLFSRVGFPDEILAFVHRNAQTDALFRRNGSVWELVGSLSGTGAEYDVATWLGKVWIADGLSDDLQTYDGTNIAAVTEASFPTKIQYLVVHQERLLMGGGPDNRSRLWFTDVITETVGGTNFHDIRVGTGGEISGLGINSITTSEQGAQTQVAIFKTDSIVSIHGVLGSGEEILAVRSIKVGLLSHKTIVNTRYGLIFTGQNSVYLLEQSGGEPIDVGAELGDEIRNCGQPRVAAAYLHNDFYHLSLAASGQVTNSREWMLNINPRVFPQRINWYGPHIGDQISDYVVQGGSLFGATELSTALWQLMVVGNHFSMSSQITPRIAKLTTMRFTTPDLNSWMVDAVGILGSIGGGRLTITTDVSVVSTNVGDVPAPTAVSMIWDLSLWDSSLWSGTRIGPAVVRPRLRGVDTSVTISHDANASLEIHSIFIRWRKIRRQPESLI